MSKKDNELVTKGQVKKLFPDVIRQAEVMDNLSDSNSVFSFVEHLKKEFDRAIDDLKSPAFLQEPDDGNSTPQDIMGRKQD